MTHPRTVHLARRDVACGGRHVYCGHGADCGAPHGARCVRHARGWCAYGARTVEASRAKLPCASGTFGGTACMCHGSRTCRGNVNKRPHALRLRCVWRGCGTLWLRDNTRCRHGTAAALYGAVSTHGVAVDPEALHLHDGLEHVTVGRRIGHGGPLGRGRGGRSTLLAFGCHAGLGSVRARARAQT